jgi:Tfp pilus assembly protein PilX
MKHEKLSRGLRILRRRVHAKGRDKKGVALITALIFLGVTMLLGLSIMLTTSSDVFISGTMRNSKTAFYAADAGVSVMRTALVNALKAATPPNLADYTQTVFPCTQDFSNGIKNTALGNAGNGNARTLSSYSSYGDSGARYTIDTTNDGAGQPRTSFSCVNVQAPAQPFAQNASRNELYMFAYQITSNGDVPGGAGNIAASSVIEKGTITYSVDVDVIDTATQYFNLLFSFAGYGMFIDNYDPHSGSTLLHGTITGRVHTNGEWGFSTGSPNYVFTDQVSSVNQNACYYFSSCVDRNAASATSGGQTIAPQFMSGFTRGTTAVPLPGNSNNQAAAVFNGAGFDPNNIVDSNGNPVIQPSPACLQSTCAPQRNVVGLVNASGAAYSSGTTGVYVPVTQYTDPYTHITTTTTAGAGIYVNGSVDNMTLDARTAGLQIYSITQGSNTTTVTYNLLPTGQCPTGSTTVTRGGSTLSACGLPTNAYPVNPNRPLAIQPATSLSLYVNGNINSLHGPGAGLPAVQDHAAMTITATGNITITGDLIYNTRPVTMTQGQVAPGVPPNSPPGTLIPGNDNGQALGIYTATGNIFLDVGGISSRNIEVDASMATLSNGGSGGITIGTNGVYANNINIVGGRIQNNIMTLGNSSTVRNVLFDRRYANSAYAPPFFPSTSGAVVRGTNHAYTYTVVSDPDSLKAIATTYVVPSRLVTAANAGH